MIIAFACVPAVLAALLTFLVRVYSVEHTKANSVTQRDITAALPLALGVGVIVFIVAMAAVFVVFAALFEM